jgi:hypothetical protein
MHVQGEPLVIHGWDDRRHRAHSGRHAGRLPVSDFRPGFFRKCRRGRIRAGVVSVGFAASAMASRATTLEVAAQAFTITQTTASDAPPSTRLLLPQLAFGGGWYTALYFSNTTSSPVSFSVNFISDTGLPLTVPTLGGSQATVNLSARGTAVIEAPNLAQLPH